MNKICYLPWVGLDVSPQGKFKPCCKYRDNIAENIDDYYNSPELKKLQTAFLNGEQPAACARCWRDEAAGIESKRQLDWKYVLNEHGPELTALSILSLPFGNTCNLACRTCNSSASSRWLKEERSLIGLVDNLRLASHKKFYKDSNFINKIKQHIGPDIKHIEFPGGEPFITGISEHLEFLDYLISNCKVEQLSLHYTTNTTTFPEIGFWDRWKKFKKVDIQLSIDGSGKQFEYLRWPASWNQCYSNIKQYQEYQLGRLNIQLSVSHTLSLLNVFYLPEFIHWCEQENLPYPYTGLVSNPDYYSISNLSYSTRLELSKIAGMPAAVCLALLQDSTQSIDLDKTAKYIKILDTQRNQNFAETFPEYYQLLRETCPTLSQLY